MSPERAERCREYRRRYKARPDVKAKRKAAVLAWSRTAKGKRTNWIANMRREYGLTVEQFDAMLISQCGRCATCGEPFGPTRQTFEHIDHCHKTGKVRGLLCPQCNKALGLARDNPMTLFNMYMYLLGDAE